ncbi:hypothetical protein QJS10_CPB12g00712 [Acorus calamus]|uniref:Uncharacterized protein n=1 Tax=Acorus calamus TaxID=4465 RepID=A0AAV9DPN7_ACOCL|nr:hypothetical protein QJS10_CPB12g00712 [Acorus calamus]
MELRESGFRTLFGGFSVLFGTGEETTTDGGILRMVFHVRSGLRLPGSHIPTRFHCETDGESLEDIREAHCGLNGVSWPRQGISGFPQLPCSTNVQIHQDGNALLLNRCWAPILISANGLDRRALSGVEFMLPVFNGNMNLNFNLNHKKL